ncbi:proline iminopeptidase-family hydrolase [Streptosporangium sp. NBC_01639]|uniref:proline iminopeptidase-family hydrolase n=1 Tax=Streptosporangium sp. NBC_01639 TaxID=2975948 RepID=UPI00386917E1|nr:proline iminopeptidase-family hydrolase [Streptosporangium sp. NBC_01639]
MAIPAPTTQGSAPFEDGHTWYRVTGDLNAGKAPLVVLHGGPGAAHDYTLRMARLAEQGRAVVHYDQFGVGLSTHLPDRGADFWTVRLFLDELDNLLAHLGIADRYHLIGQSWGGMLAAEHAVLRPGGLKGLVIADSPASMHLWREECDRLRAELPAEVERTLREHEAAGTTGSPEYRAAEKVFNARHVCTVVPNPPEVLASDAKTAEDPTVYHTMNGPSEFHVVGTLRDWSVVDRLHQVTAPTLLVSGRHDEATPRTVQPFADHIPDVRWQVFEHSSHMPHIEEEELFLQVVGSFLDSTD